MEAEEPEGQLSILQRFREYIERIFIAVTYAEAGDHDTAEEIMK